MAAIVIITVTMTTIHSDYDAVVNNIADAVHDDY